MDRNSSKSRLVTNRLRIIIKKLPACIAGFLFEIVLSKVYQLDFRGRPPTPQLISAPEFSTVQAHQQFRGVPVESIRFYQHRNIGAPARC